MMRTTKYGTYTFLRSDFDLKYGIIDLAEKDFRYSCGDVMSKRWDVFDSEEEADKFTQKIAQIERINQEFEIKNAVYNNLTNEFLEFDIKGKSGEYCDIYFKDNGKKMHINFTGIATRFRLTDIFEVIDECNKAYYDYEEVFNIINKAYNYETLDEEEQEIFNVFKELL